VSSVSLIHGDCLEVMPTLEANSIDAIVCDPPYGLSFMGKHWDHGVPGVAFWAEALRVAKPGAMLLAFGGTRTFHRLTVAIEDAGWEIRDCLTWLYGSGFPKSHNISAAIDKHLGAERNEGARQWSGGQRSSGIMGDNHGTQERTIYDTPVTDEAKRFAGWGSSLKPAWEPIIMAMKPIDGTFAANALKWNVAGLNVDACRIGIDSEDDIYRKHAKSHRAGNNSCFAGLGESDYQIPQGRWPANLLLDEEAAAMLDEQSGISKSPDKPIMGIQKRRHDTGSPGKGVERDVPGVGYGDTGGASRFFYVAKASKRDRNEGLEGMEERHAPKGNFEGRDMENPKNHLGGLQGSNQRNHHPTVKPTQLMRYLCRMVTRPNGVILDPFMGSGSTGKAAMLEGFRFVGIELDAEYLEIAKRRIAHAEAQNSL
jgi:DNA modification methylase